MGMGCKCQEKKTKDPTQACQDPDEESFRQAYLRLNKEYVNMSAIVLSLKREIAELQSKLNGKS